MNQNYYELCRLVLPTSNFIDYTELFVNKKEKMCNFNGAMRICNVYKFNTWMNMFAAKKHYYYCELGRIYLKLDIEGKYILQVIGSNRNTAFDRIDDILLNAECSGSVEIEVPNASMYEGLFYTIIEDKKSPVVIKGGAWCTDKEPRRDNKLAIVSCTFKREEYVKRNIEKFETFLQENCELKDKIKMFFSDNGKTLSKSLNSENVTIYPNMNAGGAGGFTRGLMEVIKLNQGFSRILFMDDDVEIFPESFYRTLILSNYLKDKFKDAFINGAMLDLYKKNVFFENLAVQNKLWVSAYYGEQKLKYNNILKINSIPAAVFNNPSAKVDTAWWYHCFSAANTINKGLPFPCFFRGDDVEWSWRHYGQHHISINGICVWHAPFKYRVSKIADYYYLPRNMFYENMLYTSNFKRKYKKYFKAMAEYLIKTYDYLSFDILIQAMNDILKGSDIFRENPEEQFKEINKISKKAEYIDCEDISLLETLNKRKNKKRPFKRLLHFLLLNGKLCPKFLCKKCSRTIDWYPPVQDFMFAKTVEVYNLLTKKYTVRRPDYKKESQCRREFNGLLNKIEKNYDNLHKDFVNSHKEFVTFEFWEKYLELDKVNEKECLTV